ncbi:sulfite exporter TauE/SafE family protein [Candidatus Roizmanbacteria bacterium]|nr:sulfite exporter TauE/SafE family protein [Candidatus Roizmanbacteria bacterium]
MPKRLFDVGAIAIILFIVFFFAQELNIIPSFSSGATLTLSTVFILGLVASTSTCMATSGALFLTTIGKLNSTQTTNYKLPTMNFVPAISFNLGRILSYGFFGLLAGFLGKTLINNFQLSSMLTLVVSFFMVIIGLDMAKIISLQSIFTQTFTKSIFLKLEHRLIKNPKKTAFFLGAITYLLPCGFTQTVQLYALGLADPVKSALIMMVFAIGTMPALMAIGLTSSFTRSSYYPAIQKVMGTLVFLIGVYYFNNFLGIYGIDVLPTQAVKGSELNNVIMKNGFQLASMNVNFSGYSPNIFSVKKNVPVRWEINGENVFGCQGYLVAPKLGIQKTLALGKNIIEFTPKEEGTIGFSCGMGMYRGYFNVDGS